MLYIDFLDLDTIEDNLITWSSDFYGQIFSIHFVFLRVFGASLILLSNPQLGIMRKFISSQFQNAFILGMILISNVLNNI